jgi:hypothetical protein
VRALVVLATLVAMGCGRSGFDAPVISPVCMGESCVSTGCTGGSACDDGDECTVGDVCRDGVCAGVFDGQLPFCSTCAELGGAACAGAEICISAPLSASDTRACCSVVSDCLDRSGSLVGETPLVVDPVTIDGDRAEWAGVPRLPVTKLAIGAAPSAADFSADVAVQWDAIGFHVLVEVTDDVLWPFESGSPYNNDSIEIYFDLDPHDLDSTYDADEDWSFVQQTNSVNLSPWVASAGFGSDPNGWWFEVTLEWPDGPPDPDTVIGFDVAINDDDGPAGAGRQNQLWWNDGTGQLFTDASLIGWMRLKSDSEPSELPVCGDDLCESPETQANCPADC